MVDWVVEPLVPSVLADVRPTGWDGVLRIEVAVPPVDADRYLDSVFEAEDRGESPPPSSGRFSGPATLFSAEQRRVVDCIFDHPEHLLEQSLRIASRQVPIGGIQPRAVFHLLVQRPEAGIVEMFAHVDVPSSEEPVVVRLVQRELTAPGC